MGIFDKLKKKKGKEVSAKEVKEAVFEIPTKEVKEVKTGKKPAAKKAQKVESESVVSDNKAPKAKTSMYSQANVVLLKTLVSEKAAIAEGKGVYTFVVNNKTNKFEVKKAVKEIYGVAPEKVRMINVEGREVRFGNRLGRQSGWKKAIVTLPKGKTINIHEGV